MQRRYFLRATALGIIALPFTVHQAIPAVSLTEQTDEDTLKDFPLAEVTIDTLQQKMQSGAWTAESIVKMYLKQIAAIDKKGPRLNAVIELNPDAVDIARTLDRERKAGKVRGLMHGIPVLVKDNIDTGDRMMTTAGALALEGNYASKDAFIIRQLRASGAVILGKTNLSEWANFRSTRSSSGWSSRGGQTKNPYLLDRSPCGSSSGSGAAVAANLCAVAIGTETNGSIACPSSINGIVGIKPTVGLLSRSGIIPISHTQDTAGPMARSVRDAAILLGALTGADPEDPVTSGSTGKSYTDYTGFLHTKGLQGKRIGIEKSFLKVHEGVDALLQQAIVAMKGQGAEIVEVELMDKLKGLNGQRYAILQYEFKDGVNKYLAKANAKVKNLQEVITFNWKNEARTMPYFKQEILESSNEKGDLQTPEYLEALEKVLNTTRGAIDTLLRENRLDAIAGPSNGPSWCVDHVNGDHFTGYGAYSPAAVAGYPSIVVPMGLVSGLPIGLAMFGPAYSEPQLIAMAYAYEQASMKRVAPGFVRSSR
ncbi:MAG: amidase [Thermoanaerobaculia bacterium]|nr:amidase [Thermoanaerobaculia bacterium]